MLNLNHLNIDLEKAKKEHYEFFRCYITKRLFGRECLNPKDDNQKCFCKDINKRTPKSSEIKLLQDFVSQGDNLKTIITGTIEELEAINLIFISLVDKEFGRCSYKNYTTIAVDKRKKQTGEVFDFFKDVYAIFNYDCLSKDNIYNSYILTENLGVRSCIYCNRTYAVTHRKKTGHRLMNPQLDHWFTQSKHPLLQISFHNLIPCCEVCNSRVKNDIEFNLNDHYHPYQLNEEKINFSYNFNTSINKYSIVFNSESDEKITRTSKKMYIDEMYDAHHSELDDLIKTAKAYSKNYLKSLKSIFPGANLTDNEIYRFAFGTELDSKDFHKRPMSKFKYDILKELGIIP